MQFGFGRQGAPNQNFAPNRNYELQKKITLMEFPYNRLNTMQIVEHKKSCFHLKYSFWSPFCRPEAGPIPPATPLVTYISWDCKSDVQNHKESNLKKKIIYIYIYIYVCVCVFVCVCILRFLESMAIERT